jgi:hypothetical protein
MSLMVTGNTQAFAANTVVSNVVFVNSTTGTFDIFNANATSYAYVAVVNTAAAAAAVGHPTVGAASGLGLILPPLTSKTITGDFGLTGGNVWVAGLTTTGTANLYVTPVRSN